MGKFASRETTNTLLLLLVVPVIFFILKILSSIFIPLIIACFFVLLFMPMIRWANHKNIPRWISIVFIFIIFFIVVRLCILVISFTSKEFLTTDVQTWQNLIDSFNAFVCQIGGEFALDKNTMKGYLHDNELIDTIYSNLGKILATIKKTATMIFMSMFFLILLLASSINIRQIFQMALFKGRMPSMRTYLTIEKSIAKFIFVKLIISLLTGISFSLLCYFFHVKFFIFWGVLAFVLNFIQMIGSIVSTAIMCLFAIVEIPELSVLIVFIIIAVILQLLFGSILEPIFQGKTFAINTVTIIIMLLFWGYLWNIPGMILAVPLTVVMKTILEQFDRTRFIAQLMS